MIMQEWTDFRSKLAQVDVQLKRTFKNILFCWWGVRIKNFRSKFTQNWLFGENLERLGNFQ